MKNKSMRSKLKKDSKPWKREMDDLEKEGKKGQVVLISSLEKSKPFCYN